MYIKPTPPVEEQLETDAHKTSPAGIAQPELEEPPALPPNEEWDQAAEQEWSEHSTNAWALAHVIHRIRSTPLPPILPPEQRRQFQKVVQMAAALMEEWQRRERDQAQQLIAHHPFAEEPNNILLDSQPAPEEQAAEEPDHKGVVVQDDE